MEFNELFDQHVGTVIVRQSRFADMLGKEFDWDLDLEAGKIIFDNEKAYPIQLLGTESEAGNTWLWCWANEDHRPFDGILQFGNRLRVFGENYDVREFREPCLPLDDTVNGTTLSILSAGLEKRSCYFRGHYDGGGLFCLVQDLPDTVFAPLSVQEIMRAISQFLPMFEEVNHKAAVFFFLREQGFDWVEIGTGAEARRGEDVVLTEFDEWNRLTSLQGSVPPEANESPDTTT
ncbi:MAG: hypothetical protein LBV45_00870 [Xanthomonadaceae bacterium]|nr:hypothetical protein [Xanthomonadaceae bacterium]